MGGNPLRAERWTGISLPFHFILHVQAFHSLCFPSMLVPPFHPSMRLSIPFGEGLGPAITGSLVPAATSSILQPTAASN